MSPCVKSGKLDCLHCHTSSGRYKFKAEEKVNDACLPCHQDKVTNSTAHTHHKPGTPGNKCISCHMPMTEFARMRRSDHSMLPPTPATTIAFKSPNACNNCHSDKSPQWADERVREWRERDYQEPGFTPVRGSWPTPVSAIGPDCPKCWHTWKPRIATRCSPRPS